MLVAFANRNGRFRGLAYTRRPDPPEAALAGCIDYLGRGAKVAIVFCDEPVPWGPPPDDLATWFGCDDDVFRSIRFALEPDPDQEWWDVG